MLKPIIKILFVAVALDASAGAYEDYQDDKVIVFYECFTCTDVPNINHQAYAVQFPPILTTT